VVVDGIVCCAVEYEGRIVVVDVHGGGGKEDGVSLRTVITN
jgi:hypothetical protein